MINIEATRRFSLQEFSKYNWNILVKFDGYLFQQKTCKVNII